MVLRETGSSRMAYFPGDIERSYWLTGHGDLLRLLHNTIRWITHDERIVHVEGEGFIEMFCWETTPGYAVHLLNYTNPNAHPWMDAVDLSARPADRQDEVAAECEGEIRRAPAGRAKGSLSAWKARYCSSPYRASKTTR